MQNLKYLDDRNVEQEEVERARKMHGLDSFLGVLISKFKRVQYSPVASEIEENFSDQITVQDKIRKAVIQWKDIAREKIKAAELWKNKLHLRYDNLQVFQLKNAKDHKW